MSTVRFISRTSIMKRMVRPFHSIRMLSTEPVNESQGNESPESVLQKTLQEKDIKIAELQVG